MTCVTPGLQGSRAVWAVLTWGAVRWSFLEILVRMVLSCNLRSVVGEAGGGWGEIPGNSLGPMRLLASFRLTQSPESAHCHGVSIVAYWEHRICLSRNIEFV